jgi:hypothetical protein
MWRVDFERCAVSIYIWDFDIGIYNNLYNINGISNKVFKYKRHLYEKEER